ncbi:His Kinase A (phospho-acceptor) domain-containing protein [Malonomonas rubra DSM 5091]|uniref:histidine kinase n=1 Tax=Malonomonas rubra DSM 5091 TaxID=1122189 RepID=A0A1M6FCE4_MALRU|nr:transporter substrate-binding domain-containing protein [Malonomonas rubra]SHI95347.1 His Kinase A (phospho-acceptor) domain-containing protein [Malonomonas rubra DSM 5091]
MLHFLRSACLLICSALFVCLPVGWAQAYTGETGPLALTAEEEAWIQAHPVVRLAPDPDFPPLEYLDNNLNYRGIAADFVALLEKKLPLKFEIVRMDNWSDVVQAAKDRRIDMWGAAVPTPERLEYMLFTKPFVEFPAVVLVRDSEQDFPKLNYLQGKRVAVVANYADHEYMKRAHPEIPLEVMPDISAGLRQVSFGKVDAMILNIASASYYIAKDGITNLKVTEDTDFIFDLSFACRSDWPVLQSILSKGMATITPQERKKILDNWVSLGKEGWRPSPTFILTVVVVLFLFILLLVLQWNRSLKTQVAQRTGELQKELEEREAAELQTRKLQEQVNRSKKMEALGLLAGGVAHDLNNILAGVSGYAELMLMKLPEDSPCRKHASAVRDSGERAAAVVADMLTISRNAASDKKTINLNRLVKEYLFSPEHAELQKRFPQVKVDTKLDEELLNISCSVVHIKKTILNLVLNAAEATKEGNILLQTKNCYIDSPFGQYEEVAVGEYVRLQICDNGPGIAAEDIEHIFEPFFTRKKLGHSGTGLGLAVVWNTVQDHGGYIDVDQPERGSCFKIYLPVCRGEISAEEIADCSELQANGERILVIDDEEQIRDLASQMLTTLGYSVSVAESGEEALAMLREEQFDLLLLDMIMEPGMNGRETYERAVALRPGQKALISSGFSESDEVKLTQKAGASGYLKKPYSMRELGSAVKEVQQG